MPSRRALREVDAERLERVGDLLVLCAVVLDASRAALDRRTTDIDLRHAVRDVVDDVEPRDALLLEQVDRVRVALAKHRRDHVAGRHLLATGGLDVHRGALEHALERERLIGTGLFAFRQLVDLLVEEALEVAAQAVDAAAALDDDIGAGRVVEDRQQQVLERQVLVAASADIVDGTLKSGLQLGRQHGFLIVRRRDVWVLPRVSQSVARSTAAAEIAGPSRGPSSWSPWSRRPRT